MIDEHRVQHPHPRGGREAVRVGAPDVVVLQVGVLEPHYPAIVGAARAVLLLDVGGHANAGAITGRHSEVEVRSSDVEPVRSLAAVGCLGCFVGGDLEVAEDDAAVLSAAAPELSGFADWALTSAGVMVASASIAIAERRRVIVIGAR